MLSDAVVIQQSIELQSSGRIESCDKNLGVHRRGLSEGLTFGTFDARLDYEIQEGWRRSIIYADDITLIADTYVQGRRNSRKMCDYNRYSWQRYSEKHKEPSLSASSSSPYLF